MNDVSDELILSLRSRVLRTTGVDDYAQEACIDLLYTDLTAKPLEYIISDLVNKYKKKAARAKKRRREIAVSELLSKHNDADHLGFLDSLQEGASAPEAEPDRNRVPDNLRPLFDWVLLGYPLEIAAKLSGISYDAARKRLSRCSKEKKCA